MTVLDDHPTVALLRSRNAEPQRPSVDTGWLRDLCLRLGADDVGFVDIDRPEVADQRRDILELLPGARTLIAFVRRSNRESLRAPARSVANLDFHQTTDEINHAARGIVTALAAKGVRALNPAAGFPMEMDRWGGRQWVLSHKPIAVAAGLGQIGIHRNVIHPRFGSFVLLGTVVTDAVLAGTDSNPIDYNPCVECKLCVAACPTGAIHPDGAFDFAACYTHNYREFMGGFADWVETLADSPSASRYRARVSDSETVSLWQSLSYGPSYKAAYCIAVCPAGEDVMAPFLHDRGRFVQDVVRPFQEKKETVYVVEGSDAEAHVAHRFPKKSTTRVGNGLRAQSIAAFPFGARLTFLPGRARGLHVAVHFTFTGAEPGQVTIGIPDGTIETHEGHVGTADVRVTVDSATWLKILGGDAGVFSALVRGKLRVRGSLRLFRAFGRCFPS